ncbi:MAG: hypothetical protein M3O50_06590, partial [Myxococcota bacterium]|nr:hypothetical protein [Myxococcota bacterium]
VDSAHGARAEASARFVRVATPATSSEALRAIGAEIDLPRPGTCASLASLATALTPRDRAPVVELLDVGAVTIETQGISTRLLPRQLPDVTDVVSGVVYARALDPALLPTGARYLVHAAGVHEFAPVDVSASGAGNPSDVRLSGEDAQGVLVPAGVAVELVWAPTAIGDLVYVDVNPSGVRCAFGDVGHAVVPTVFFDEAGTFVVHRLHREPLRVSGSPSGEIRFDFARSVAYVRH